MTTIDNRAELWSRAACSTADPELFFPIAPAGPAVRQMARAKAICARCEIRQACLGYALAAGPLHGVWGGTTEAERRRLGQRGSRPRSRSAQGRTAAGYLVGQAAKPRSASPGRGTAPAPG